MTADEIAAAIETHRMRMDEGDEDNTVVLDAHDDATSDDAPTADYDPRARVALRVQPAAKGGTPQPMLAVGPQADAVRADGARRRSSRRTVKIPDEPVRRGEVPPAPPPPVEVFSAPPTVVDDPDAPTPLPATSDAEVHGFGPLPSIDRPAVDQPSGDVLRPLRIISVGSDPPPAITTAEAPWPTKAPSERPPPSSDVETVRTNVSSTTKTDLLPPPVIIEDGWTPEPTPVALAAAAELGASREARAHAAAPSRSSDVDIDIEATEATTEGDDLLVDIEPEATPSAARKPPPVPARDARLKTDGAAPPVETKPVAAEPAKPKQKAWFEDMFSEDYIKTMDILPPENVRQEVDFIEESLGVEREAVILDLGCGRGEHAVELALRGYNVVGIDLSPVALAASHENLRRGRAARDKLPDAAKLPALGKSSFLRTDMRELDFQENFDGAYCWATSFGYFDDETNLDVLRRLHRALRQGGMLLIDVANRDFVAPRSPSLVWFEGDECVCMDDMCVDFLTSRLKVKRTAMFEDGHSREVEYSIRLYSLDTLGKMLHEVGFRVVEATGLIAHPGIFFGTESPRLIVLAERA